MKTLSISNKIKNLTVKFNHLGNVLYKVSGKDIIYWKETVTISQFDEETHFNKSIFPNGRVSLTLDNTSDICCASALFGS